MWKRDKSNMDVDRLKARVAMIDWTGYYECENVDLLSSFLEEKLGAILEAEAPLKGYQARARHRNWVSAEMKAEMAARDKLKETARISGSPAAWNTYRRARNLCSKNLIKTKDLYHKEMYKKFEKDNDTKNIYRTTRNILNWKTGGMPRTFLVEGGLYRKPRELADIQQNFFVKKN